MLGVYAQLRSAGQLQPRLPAVPAPATTTPIGDPAAELTAAARAVAAELGAIADPGPRVLEAIDRVGACLELVAAEDVWPADLELARLPRNGAALSTDACARYSEALGASGRTARRWRRGRCATCSTGCWSPTGATTPSASAPSRGWTSRTSSCETRRLLRDDDELRERYAGRFERSWSTSCRTPTASSWS